MFMQNILTQIGLLSNDAEQSPTAPSQDRLAQAYSDRSVDPKVLHVLNRLAFGPRPGDIAQVSRMGVQQYIQQQLSPESIPVPPALQQQLSSFQTLRMSPVALYNASFPFQVRLTQLKKEQQMGGGKRDQGMQPGQGKKMLSQSDRKTLTQEVLRRREKETREETKQIQARVSRPIREATQARLLRALNSPRQLEEVMVNFWFNHFNVNASKSYNRSWVGVYEEQAIRPYALGSFRQLLGATAHHPAMLLYLDNFASRVPTADGKGGLNENYARELMELHTLGVDGGYTQKDVREVARVFTGWRFVPLDGSAPRAAQAVQSNAQGIPDFLFDAKMHDFEPKTVLGKTIAGSGYQEGIQILDLLAAHPSTARNISYKLAQYFVSDQPPDTLVQRMASRFTETKGNIRAVLGTLFQSSEFWAPNHYRQKFRTPYEYVLALARATGQTTLENEKWTGLLRQLNMPLYACPTPDGYKNTREAWLSPDGMMRRLNIALGLSRGGGAGGNPNQILQTLGNSFSQTSMSAFQSIPQSMLAAAILGSPEMMTR
jgi:uncharacterized protein (DUF1800 family)